MSEWASAMTRARADTVRTAQQLKTTSQQSDTECHVALWPTFSRTQCSYLTLCPKQLCVLIMLTWLLTALPVLSANAVDFSAIRLQTTFFCQLLGAIKALTDNTKFCCVVLSRASHCLPVSNNEYSATNVRWRRSIVVRTLVSTGELSTSCARLLAGRVTTLWLSRLLSVSQHGQLSHPSLRGR